MTSTKYRLIAALLLSLCLHGMPILQTILTPAVPLSATPPIHAKLRPLPIPVEAPSPNLQLPESRPPRNEASKPHRQSPPASDTPKTWTQSVRKQLKKLDTAGRFYPAEAIARGLEGEALVLLIIDDSGQVVAARIEQSSGHAILDDAALRAARTLKSLPAGDPRQTILPIRFRLK
ncbi:MAG: energy transducer TonB [Betaproteobacteria bacterium]|nr:energy transducer TonB [Betaproteobacteria bacterium]